MLEWNMRSAVHVAMMLLTILQLNKPFESFSTTKSTTESADCCKRGKCRPSTGDDCCKSTLPDGKNLLAASNTQQQDLPLVPRVVEIVLIAEPTFTPAFLYEIHGPPGSPPGSRFNL